MAENTREIVLDMLLAIERGEQFSNQLIKAVLDKYNYMDNRDKAFMKRVTEGTLERQIELDYYLNQFSSVPVRKMKPLIRCLLRMSVYQLLYMDSVPDSAVCNEACKLAMKRKFSNLRGFVNGVLRNISREKETLKLPDEMKNPKQFYSVKYSMPEWLVDMWMQEYGQEITGKLLQGLLEIHPVSIRFRTDLSAEERAGILRKMEEVGVEARQSSYLDYCYALTHTEDIQQLPGFAEGLWTVQDVSSALAVEAAGIKKDDFVIDVCAAPGGKTMLAAEKAGRVLSRDVSEEKIERISENIERMGLTNVELQVWDATVEDSDLRQKADVVLMDVPCSGLGILGKKRDIKYHVTPEGLESLGGLQKQIAKSCIKYLKPGGTLIYSTCTIHREENEEMVRFLTEELGMEPISLKECLPERLLQEKEAVESLQSNTDGLQTKTVETEKDKKMNQAEKMACIQLLPGYMESDGFFIARFRAKK